MNFSHVLILVLFKELSIWTRSLIEQMTIHAVGSLKAKIIGEPVAPRVSVTKSLLESTNFNGSLFRFVALVFSFYSIADLTLQDCTLKGSDRVFIKLSVELLQ